MPIDASIALGYKPPEVADPMEQQQKLLTLKALKDQDAFNQLKMQDYQKTKQQEDTIRSIYSQNGGDLKKTRDALLSGGWHEQAAAIDKALAEQGKNQAEIDSKGIETAHKKLDIFSQHAGYVMQNPTPENAFNSIKQMQNLGVISPEIANQWAQSIPTTPEGIKQWATQAFQSGLATKAQLPILERVDTGGQIQFTNFDPITGNATVTGSVAKTETPDSIASNKLKAANSAFNPDGTPNKAVQGYEMNKSRAGASSVSVGFPKETFKNERDLRNDFQGLPTTKAFREVQTAYDQITTALKNPSAANDLAAATKFMKLLDPGSVVRESELAMAMEATGKLDQFMNYANRIKTGEKLTPSQRKDFANAASALYSAASGRYNESADEYRAMAQDYQLNPDRIAKKTNGTVNPKQQNNQPATVNNGWSITKVK